MQQHDPQFIAFDGVTRVDRGPLAQVLRNAKRLLAVSPASRVQVFDAQTSELFEIDHLAHIDPDLAKATALLPSETPVQGLACAKAVRPGRPRLGVVAREVTLLPRHWDWLNAQPGGASVALRKLVEQARHLHQSCDSLRAAQEASYRFMSVMAGDREGLEEAARALFAGARERFVAQVERWPDDIREHLLRLAEPAFEPAWNEGKRHA